MRVNKFWKKAAGYICCALGGAVLGAQMAKTNPPVLDDLVTKNENWYQLTIKDETMTHKYLIYHDEYRNFQLLMRQEEQFKKGYLNHKELADLCIKLDKNSNGILEKEELK